MERTYHDPFTGSRAQGYSQEYNQDQGPDQSVASSRGEVAEYPARQEMQRRAHLADRTRRHLRERRRQRMRGDLPEWGAGYVRATLMLPLLETEALALEVDYSWQTLFPDTTPAEDEPEDEPESADDGDDDAGLADW